MSAEENNTDYISSDSAFDDLIIDDYDNSSVINLDNSNEHVELENNNYTSNRDLEEIKSNSNYIISSDVTKYYKNATQYHATFLKVGGGYLSNTVVVVKVNNVNYQRITDSNGIAKLNINLENPGVYSVVVNYAGTDSGTIYKSSSTYHVIYEANNNSDLRYNYGTFPDLIDRPKWINPDSHMISNNQPLSDVICVDNQYIQQLSAMLNGYDCLIENVISLNTYVSSTDYQYYVGCAKTSVETLTSFSGNCVDETNLFVALSRCANFPTRYVDAYSKFGGDGHMWGQVLVDNVWICVDNSITNSNYVKLSAAYQLGNKDYLSQNFNIHFYAYSLSSNSNIYGFQVPNLLCLENLNQCNYSVNVAVLANCGVFNENNISEVLL